MKVFGKGGKFNIIDVVVVLILVVAIAFVGMKFLGGGEDAAATGDTAEISKPNMRFVVFCSGMHPDTAASFDEWLGSDTEEFGGYQENMTRIFNSGKFIDAEVVAWEAEAAEDGTMNMYFTIEANALSAGGTMTVGVQEIRVGLAYNVKTLCMEYRGEVVSLERIA